MNLSLIPESVLDKIHMEPNSGCWLFVGPKGAKHRYGFLKDPQRKGRSRTAHVAIFEMVTQQRIPAGTEGLHNCDNKRCVNPLHIRVGTHKENMMDSSIRLRNKRHIGSKFCHKGHDKTLDGGSYIAKSKSPLPGRKVLKCRICALDYYEYVQKPRNLAAKQKG